MKKLLAALLTLSMLLALAACGTTPAVTTDAPETTNAPETTEAPVTTEAPDAPFELPDDNFLYNRDVAFVSEKGNGKRDGSSPENTATLAEGLGMTKNGGTIVICGPITLDPRNTISATRVAEIKSVFPDAKYFTYFFHLTRAPLL